jgi:hypothetical protein
MSIWAFNGNNSKFPSGIFTEKEIAETWIKKYRLSGILTHYPLDEGVYNWAIFNGSFSVKNEEETKPEFIQRFSSASQEHYHYENGNLE